MWARLLVSLLIQVVFFSAIMLVPAWAITGSWDWPRGWLLLAVMLAGAVIGGVGFAIVDPGLVNERAKMPAPQTLADGFATGFIGIAVVAWCIAAPLDVFRLHLIAPPPPAVSLWGGLAVFSFGIIAIVWTLRANSFAATVVKVQEERQQRVIDTGPYALVRHPMYFGAIWFFAGAALVLESPALALASIPLFVLAFLPRMLVEEATLKRDLDGYAAYQARVRARILPGVF